ncbi:response regulator transcription factor [Acidaminobacter sp. JC074]|uniref:LytR/AlgR family response regulator transcription factor n=1 Tax=Acidaminobacter sp. JC074 TaxID=2530199 RepID=UPI001F0F2E49|nr:LytTR family DNA-binding domain-containing protein [Acidaminobacter sp. JC074]MCH4890294.1 response regulator transcription factor [Acidaminobacter sp. JC074]
MVNILIVEDEIDTQSYIKHIVESSLNNAVVYTAFNHQEALEVSDKNHLDLVLLDMELDGTDILGLDVYKSIESRHKNIDTIVITGHSDYLRQATGIEPFYYMMKPINEVFLKRKLKEWVYVKENVDNETLIIKQSTGIKVIPLKNIYYIEKIGRKVHVVTKSKVYEYSSSIRAIMKDLDDRFYQSHQSFIVNTNKVNTVDKDYERARLISFFDFEKTVPLSRYKYEGFIDMFK